MKYLIIRHCDADDKGNLTHFGLSQAKFLAQKIKEDFKPSKVKIFSQVNKASLYTAGSIASLFLASVYPEQEMDFDWLDEKIKSISFFDEALYIFIVDIETIVYFPKEKLGLDKCLARSGRGLLYKENTFSLYDYEY